MLTADLVRARRRGDQVRPQWIDPGAPEERERAQALLATFEAHRGRTRGELDEALAERVGEGTDYLLHRGLAKLLFDRSTFEVASPRDPAEVRAQVFALARAHHPVSQRPGDPLHPVTRAEVLAQAGAALGLSPDAVERALYADLEREQVLAELEPLEPEALLHRYNLALAQAVLLRATSLEVTLAPGDPKRARQLFRFIKFFGLMHAVAGDRRSGYRVTLDGPMSLFQLSSKYGLKLAEFLPALLLCQGWSLRAQVLWGKERRAAVFELDPSAGLRSHYKERGVYVTDEERTFVERFRALESPWELERSAELVDLGGRGVLVPDLVFRHREDGREALLEIVGFWRKGYLEGRLELLRAHGPKNLVLAVSKKLAGAREGLEGLPGELSVFTDVIRAKDVLARIERVATRPAED
jgi:predicted nuclease of restriction endonuclease-like RecB superfamily